MSSIKETLKSQVEDKPVQRKEKEKIKFAVNYVFKEVMDLKPVDDIMIKYPGGKWDLETLRDLVSKGHKIVLHGIIPSSGSILDPHLCDHFEEFSKIVEITNQRWLSFHLDHKSKYEQADYDDTIKKNVGIIRERFPDMPILIENMPSVDTIEEWCQEPEMISKTCQKYDFGLLLDIPHAVISAKQLGITPEEYMKRLPLERAKEIHVSGWNQLENGELYDSHVMCTNESYELLEFAMKNCPNIGIVSLEYAPGRDYDGQNIAAEYRYTRSNQDLYNEQQYQIGKVQSIVLGKEQIK